MMCLKSGTKRARKLLQAISRRWEMIKAWIRRFSSISPFPSIILHVKLEHASLNYLFVGTVCPAQISFQHYIADLFDSGLLPVVTAFDISGRVLFDNNLLSAPCLAFSCRSSYTQTPPHSHLVARYRSITDHARLSSGKTVLSKCTPTIYLVSAPKLTEPSINVQDGQHILEPLVPGYAFSSVGLPYHSPYSTI